MKKIIIFKNNIIQLFNKLLRIIRTGFRYCIFPLIVYGMSGRMFIRKEMRGGGVIFSLAYYYDYQMKKNGLNEVCSTHMRENSVQNFSRNS